MATVTIDMLASLKRIPPRILRSFGLVDTPEGVRFEYRTSEGTRARPRLRTAMRGADGSRWVSPSILPISLYTPPSTIEADLDNGTLILVEGESDCWAAWLHGIAAYGIPGPRNVDALEYAHVDEAKAIYILREPDSSDSPTYENGVDAYIRDVVERLNAVGYSGPIHELRMPDHLYDMSELHHDDPARFKERLAVAMAAARSLKNGVQS